MKPENCISERINKKIYRDGDRCIKLFDEVFSKADVLNEALNHARVAQGSESPFRRQHQAGL